MLAGMNGQTHDPMRRGLVAAGTVQLLNLCFHRQSVAQAATGAPLAFPSRPVRLVVPAPPGSAPDLRARQLAQKLSEPWPLGVVVDNRAGATGNIAMSFVAHAAPDGHTIVLANLNSLTLLPHLTTLPFNPLNDFVAITKVSAGPLVLLAHAGTPFNSVAELVRHAQAYPGTLNAASAGTGGLAHLAIIALNRTANTSITHVPYKGGSQTTADLISGQIQLQFDFAFVAAPHLKTGRLKALAVAGEKRLAILPNVPTFAELGFPDLHLIGWQGIFAPAGTAPEIVDRLNRAIVNVLGLSDIRESIMEAGSEIGGDSPAQFAAYVKAEHARWGALIRAANIRLE